MDGWLDGLELENCKFTYMTIFIISVLPKSRTSNLFTN